MPVARPVRLIALRGFVTLLTLAATTRIASAQTPATAPSAPPLAVPRTDKITIDGDGGDWDQRGAAIDVLTEATPTRKPFSTGDAAVRLGWDEDGLLVRVDVTDDAFVESTKDNALWERDGIELFVATGDGRKRVQFIVTPGLDPARQGKSRTQVVDYRSATDRVEPPVATTAVGKTPTGYTLEASVPWSNLGVSPATGTEVRVQVYVNDNDGSLRNTQFLLYPRSGANSDSSRMQTLVLTDAAATDAERAPFRAVAYGAYERFRRARINVATTGDALGKQVEVRDAGQSLGAAVLAPQGRLAVASIVVPMPRQAYGPLNVTIDGKPAGVVTLADPQQSRAEAVDRLDMVVDPSFVFSRPAFPQPEFENPNLAEDLLGSYTIDTTYYDNEFKQVTTADRPGRYGAIVSITPDDGGPMIKRFITLYRAAADVDWRKEELKVISAMPAGWDVNPAVARDRWREVDDLAKWSARQAAWRNSSLAVLLAGLRETKPGTPPYASTSPGALDEAYWYELKKRTGDLVPYQYDVVLPKGYDAEETKKWPVLLFLHGSGERGRDLKKVFVHGPPKEVRAGRELPFIVVSPQCPPRVWWDPRQVKDLIDEVKAKYRVDDDRFYLTGLSMGAYGSWRLAVEYPDLFAAIVPICGGGDPLNVEPYKNIPIWIFHGGRDEVVLPDESIRMTGALREAKGRVRYTLLPDAGHDSWTVPYADPTLYEWMLQQRRGAPQEPPATQPSTQPSEIRSK